MLKTATSSELVRDIRAAVDGKLPVTPEVIQALATTHPLPAPADTVHLSPRELDTLKRVAQGQTSAEIAGMQCLSESAVKKTLLSINAKLGTCTRAQAVAEAIRLGLIHD